MCTCRGRANICSCSQCFLLAEHRLESCAEQGTTRRSNIACQIIKSCGRTTQGNSELFTFAVLHIHETQRSPGVQFVLCTANNPGKICAISLENITAGGDRGSVTTIDFAPLDPTSFLKDYTKQYNLTLDPRTKIQYSRFFQVAF